MAVFKCRMVTGCGYQTVMAFGVDVTQKCKQGVCRLGAPPVRLTLDRLPGVSTGPVTVLERVVDYATTPDAIEQQRWRRVAPAHGKRTADLRFRLWAAIGDSGKRTGNGAISRKNVR